MELRERIARIIDPVAFAVEGQWLELPSHADDRRHALTKADLILDDPGIYEIAPEVVEENIKQAHR